MPLEEAGQALTVALGPDVPAATRVAAGEMALLVQQSSLAKTIFGMVLQAEPKHPRALMGSASASLLGRDWETAGKVLWSARDLAPKEQRPALAGDARAAAALSRYEHRFARAVGSVINLLDPDVIVLGGGLSNIESLYANVPRLWSPFVFSDRVDTRLVRARHGDSSGVRGAAWLWEEEQEAKS